MLGVVALGVGLVSVPHRPLFWPARVCFGASAAILIFKIGEWGVKTDASWPFRVVLVGLGAAFILIMAVEAIRWVNEGEAAKRGGPPVQRTVNVKARDERGPPTAAPSAATAPASTAEGVSPQAEIRPQATTGMVVNRAARDAQTGPKHNHDAERAALLRQLTQLYINDHDGISSEMLAGLELPPADWLNQQLRKLRANWRVRHVNGPNAETYDVPVTPKQPEDENAFGQNGNMELGSVTEPVIDETKGVVTFRAMFTDWRFDPAAPFVFRNFTLRITHSNPPDKSEALGVKVQIIENVTAEIVSHH